MFFRFRFHPSHLLLQYGPQGDPCPEAEELHKSHQQPVPPGSCDVSEPHPDTLSHKPYPSCVQGKQVRSQVQMSQINVPSNQEGPFPHRETEPQEGNHAPFPGAWPDHPYLFSRGPAGLPQGQQEQASS